MSSNPHPNERYLVDYLYEDSPTRMVLVGKPPIDVDAHAEGIDLHQLAQLDESTLSSLTQQVTDSLAARQLAAGGQPVTDDSQAEPLERTVLVLSLDESEPGNAGLIDRTLGLAVRRFPWRVLVHCRETRIHDHQFYAFGFRKLMVRTVSDQVDVPATPHELDHDKNRALNRTASEAGSSARWYEYRLSHYKRAPDWLNARFWANPERFDQYDLEEYDDDGDDTRDDDEWAVS